MHQTHTNISNAQCTGWKYILDVLKHPPLSYVIASKTLLKQHQDILKSNDYLGKETDSLPLKRTKPLVVT